MRRVVTPLWLVLLAGILVWPQLGQRASGLDGSRPGIGRSAPEAALPAHRTSLASYLGTGLPGFPGPDSRPGGMPGPAFLRGTGAPLPVPGALRSIPPVEWVQPRAATQRHFPHFPTGPPAARSTL